MYQQISGRLGNQLFQWAYAHTLISKYKKRITFIIDDYHNPKFNKEDSIQGISIAGQICNIKKMNSVGLALVFLDKIRIKNECISSHFLEKTHLVRTKDSYELPVLPNWTPRLITGFFLNSQHVLANEIQLLDELKARLQKVNSITFLPKDYQVVHVRRGDLVTKEKGYGLLDKDYYVRNIVDGLPVVLCTDSLKDSEDVANAVKANFILTPENSSPWQTIGVFGKSKRFVMGNSTLSWWGGFVASNVGAEVIFPEPFYLADTSINEVLKYSKFIKSESSFEK